MAAYVPVLIGDTTEFREQTEAYLSNRNTEAVYERIHYLSEENKAAGRMATFGSEIEYQFVPNPQAGQVTDFPRGADDLYEEVVREIQGEVAADYTGKGYIVDPRRHKLPILTNEYVGGYNLDQSGSDIREIRPAPTEALFAIERYWRTIDTLGKVAGQHGYMALILSTQFSAAVINTLRPEDRQFTDFRVDYDGGYVLAPAQQAVQAMHPLQLDAGVEEGLIAHEAFPGKNTRTGVHPNRLEFRHPLVGVADPRVDMLAFLSGVDQKAQLAASKSAMSRLRVGNAIAFYNYMGLDMDLLEEFTVYDRKSNRLVMPTEIEWSAINEFLEMDLENFASLATGKDVVGMEQCTEVLRQVVRSARLRFEDDTYGTVAVDPKSPLKDKLMQLMHGGEFGLRQPRLRVIPEVEYDSPDLHRERRQAIAQSKIVSRVMGKASKSITPADEAIQIRKELIENSMVVEETTELELSAA